MCSAVHGVEDSLDHWNERIVTVGGGNLENVFQGGRSYKNHINSRITIVKLNFIKCYQFMFDEEEQ